MDPVVGAVHGDERLAEIVQGRLAWGSELLLGHDDPHRLPIHPAEAMDSEGVVTDDAPFRLYARLGGNLDLGDQAAGRRIPSGKRNTRRFAHQTASSVAPDDI